MPKGKSSEPRRTKPGSDGQPKPARRRRAKEQVPRADVAPLGPTQLEIAERAYQLYLDRGGAPGSDFEDWIRAERELRDARGLK